MKAEELRIGNWVNDNRELAIQVFSLDTEINHDDLTKQYNGIPLTEEWLLKFGFKNQEKNSFKNILNPYWVKKCVCLFYAEDQLPEPRVFLGGFGFSEIEDGKYHAATFGWLISFVHQLQNLYFALTGEELELKQ